MYLTISKRFEISLSYRYYQKRWPQEKNQAYYGRATGGGHGYGGNFAAYFVFAGRPDARTGMVINVATIKDRVNRLLADRYDHKFLNVDHHGFASTVPTPENVARLLWQEATPLFADQDAELAAVHVDVSPHDAATAYADGRVERHYGIEFSAARRTWSPRLTDEENVRLFGAAASPNGHGHHYLLRATVAGTPDEESGMIVAPSESEAAMRAMFMLLDHRNLTMDVPELDGLPLTTESLGNFIYERLANRIPVTRIRLWENPYFYTECDQSGMFVMGVRSDFRAAHRLHAPLLSDEENRQIYGKCNNPAGHGHRYVVEAAIDGPLDELSGTLFPLEDLAAGMQKVLALWDYKHLQTDTEEFQEHPSTGENIAILLWPKVEDALGRSLYRLRLWETPNNRFTLRRNGPDEEV